MWNTGTIGKPVIPVECRDRSDREPGLFLLRTGTSASVTGKTGVGVEKAGNHSVFFLSKIYIGILFWEGGVIS